MGKVGMCIRWFFDILQLRFRICGYSISFFSIAVLVMLSAIAGILIRGILTVFRRFF